jgi:SAM-dependent methyltransferase
LPEVELEVNALVRMAVEARAAGAPEMDHLDSPVAAFNYVRIADLVGSVAKSEGIAAPILDWGCGYGQVTWLLRRRGLEVIPCELGAPPARKGIAQLNSFRADLLDDPVRLPYSPASFGAVMSVGVLEHVQDEFGSLREISRVLRPGGLFFIFMLPNRFSWAEWVADRRHISVHPKKYTLAKTRVLLAEHGFTIERHWRRNVLPKNLTGLSPRLKQSYGRYYRQVDSVDGLLCKFPPTSMFSGVLELIARKN